MGTRSTSDEQITIESYGNIARSWSNEHGTERFWGNGFTRFEELVPAGSELLEIGMGGGRDARELIPRYKYTGTDATKAFIPLAQANNPTGRFLHQSVYDLDFPEGYFDAFWAAAVLLHIPKERIDYALQRIRKVVREGGIGFISLKEGAGERIVEETRTDGIVDKRFFAYYTKDEFAEILIRNGFEVVDLLQLPFSKTNWLMFLVRVTK